MADVENYLECSICLDTFCNPKRLACEHHFCKECLDDILIFDSDGAGMINCPKRCAQPTDIREEMTTNDLPVSYEFKGVLQALKPPEEFVENVCHFRENCMKDIALYCCGYFMCQPCHEKHEKSNQNEHSQRTSMFFSKKEKSLEILCDTHLSRCTHVSEGSFLCKYCLNRAHHPYPNVNTIAVEASKMKDEIKRHCEQTERVIEMAKITEEHFLENEKRLDNFLRKKKTACLLNYLDFLNAEEKNIKTQFNNIYANHINEYPTPLSADYFKGNMCKSDAQLVVEKDTITDRSNANACNNSTLRQVTVTLNEELNFDAHPLGELQVVFGQKVSIANPTMSTFDGVISDVEEYGNVLEKLNRELNELFPLPSCTDPAAISIKVGGDISLSTQECTAAGPNSQTEDINIETSLKSQSVLRNNERGVSEQDADVLRKCIQEYKNCGVDYICELIKKKETYKLTLLLSEIPDIAQLKGEKERPEDPLFHYSARYGDPQVLQLFLEYGESPDVTNELSSNALHLSVIFDNVQCTQWLLDNYPHLLNKQNDYGNTPLLLAAREGNLTSLKLLLEHGADPQIKTRFHQTPIQIAREKGNILCVEELVKY